MVVNKIISSVLVIVVTSLLFPQNSNAQNNITTHVPRPEFPNPQFKRQLWMNLNGPWNFSIDMGKTGIARKSYKNYKFYNKKITVPYPPESKLSGINPKGFMPQVWYHRTVVIPASWKGKRIFLHFGAVDFACRVWVNGQPVGRHVGGSTSFAFDVTPFLHSGSNDIVVMARDEIRSNVQPSGKQAYTYNSRGVYYTRTTGIWQTVWLEARPQSFIKKVSIVPDVDHSRFILTPVWKHLRKGEYFKAVLLSQNGKTLTSSTTHTNGGTVILKVKRPHLWSPGHPYLFHLVYKLMNNGQTIDKVKSYAGLRKIQVIGNKIYLNNKPIFLRLVLDQGYWPKGEWTAPSDLALKKDIKRAMRLGFNGARLHQKVFCQRFHYWADKLGFLTFGEFDDWGSKKFRTFTNAKSIRNLKRGWAETVAQYKNHPSIIAWTPMNETAIAARANIQNYRVLSRNMYDLTKALDPTRPVNNPSGYVHVKTDLFTVHDYEQNPVTFKARYDSVSLDHPQTAWIGSKRQGRALSAPYEGQPYIVDEYGGTLWLPKFADMKPRGKGRGTWGYGKSAVQMVNHIKKLTNVLLDNPNIAGFCFTQLYDVEQELNGLYTYHRKLKYNAVKLKKIFSAPAAIVQE
jgi:beta-galactosidase/beta-glucuronidase